MKWIALHEGEVQGWSVEDLYESCHPIWWLCGRLSCVLEPLLEGIHTKLFQLILNLLLLSPVIGSLSSLAGKQRLHEGQASVTADLGRASRRQKSAPDDSTQLVATWIKGSALLLIACGHAMYSFSSCSGLMAYLEVTAGPLQ